VLPCSGQWFRAYGNENWEFDEVRSPVLCCAEQLLPLPQLPQLPPPPPPLPLLLLLLLLPLLQRWSRPRRLFGL
jgi:hypothetical protein